MGIRRVVVCEVQVPFVHGGAEYHVRALHQQLRAHGYQAELVSIPFKWYPKKEILAHASAWRLIDLTESNGQPIDLVIGTKFPSYFVRHPNKVAWLIHQYRAAYELCGTAYSDFTHNDEDVGLRQTLIELDTKMLGRVPARLCKRAEHGEQADEIQRAGGRSAVPSAPVCRASRRGPIWRLCAVCRPPGVDQATGPRGSRHAARRSADTSGCGWRRHSTGSHRGAGVITGLGRSHHVCRSCRRAGADRSLQGRPRGGV